MLGSNNKFFYKNHKALARHRHNLFFTLVNFEVQDIEKWLLAYDYFCQNPHKFDGATIVKDLETINGLDASAMLHDYEYLHIQNWWSIKGLKTKLKADFDYGKHMEQTGKGSVTAYTRTVLLWLSTPFYYLIFKAWN